MTSKTSQLATKSREMEYTDVRRWRRYHVDVRLRATLSGTDKEEVTAFGRGSDLSQAGMAAFLPLELPLGAILELELTFPYSSQPIKLRAEIRNSSGFKYGVEFVDITTAQQEIIVRTCTTLELVQ